MSQFTLTEKSEGMRYCGMHFGGKVFCRSIRGKMTNETGDVIFFSFAFPKFENKDKNDLNSFFEELFEKLLSFLTKREFSGKKYAFLDFRFEENKLVFSFSFGDFENRNKKVLLYMCFDESGLLVGAKKRKVDKKKKSPYT